MPSRRTVLTAGTLIALSGCAALSGASARLAGVQLTNTGSATHEFEFTVTVDRETVYDETHTVAAEADGTTVELDGALPDRQGRITITTAIAGTELSESTTFDDDSCYDVIVEYTGDNVVHWQSGSSDCDAFR
ncbi:hypothetical protein Har1130_09190 [Haloarcula sp. CBA1130]|uniref:hypothetical protein n=1 Tax=unclassified Haloarcula TaxID=2624677 RepID=UPI00124539B6|nr:MULTISPECIES: hypothetical protein [unclassified Haloarcula]KAA9397056.1 hypothetical protein Har1129_01880 [Haloarcula sp. CBA1129]KAA9402905.1 hypothetical protein Har1130_09190 [Haloarcula sp. CBA1130]